MADKDVEFVRIEVVQSCFYCEAERREAQSFVEPYQAVTTYQGTAVCGIHAQKKYLEEKARDKRVESILNVGGT